MIIIKKETRNVAVLCCHTMLDKWQQHHHQQQQQKKKYQVILMMRRQRQQQHWDWEWNKKRKRAKNKRGTAAVEQSKQNFYHLYVNSKLSQSAQRRR